MKFTGILASLAIASTATAAALPNLEVVRIQSTVTRIEGVLDGIDTSSICNSVDNLTSLTTQLGGIHDTLNGIVVAIVGGVTSTPLVQGALNLAGGLVTSVVSVVGTTEEISDYGVLSDTLISRIQSGDVDAANLRQLLATLGGETGLSNLNTVLSQQQ
ncbi:hypothetical protein BJX63DRAFT_432179 [Aspergillus granulosus]|uniref:Uncharacterized protein n=1 Tax=Aspergillus granulosus TaxID=176169 RepID=A0ABR4HEG2_9EURO